jgi:hypothetical protein
MSDADTSGTPSRVPAPRGLQRWTRRGRLVASVILTILATISLVVGGLTLYAREEVFNADHFADNAEQALHKREVRQAISDELVQVIITKGSPSLVQAKPLLQTVVEAALDTDAFRKVFRQAVIEAHNLFFNRERKSIALDLADVGTIVIGAARSLAPQIANELPKDLDAELAKINKRSFAGTTLSIADNVRFLGILLPILSVLLWAGSVAIAPDRRGAFVRMGVAIAIAAGFVFILMTWMRSTLRIEGAVDDAVATEAIKQVWDSLLGGFVTWTLVFGVAGLVIAAAASSILRPFEVAGRAERLRKLLITRPERRWLRVVRAVALLAVSVLVVLEPSLALRVVAVIVGAYGLFFATSELLGEITQPRKVDAAGHPVPRTKQERRRLWALAGVGGAATIAAIVLIVVLATSGGRDTSGDREVVYCNGYKELCDKRFNEVVYAATHNAMSAAATRGFYFAHHFGDMRSQLRDGVRGLLIDAHDGVKDPQKNRVRTNLEGTDREKLEKALGPEGLDAVRRLGGRLGFGELRGQKRPYLCHALCEIGVLSARDGFKQISDFLDRHPDEVVLIMIEDYVSPASISKEIDEGGLRPYIHTQPADRPWPTLREMIQSGKRVVVMAEHDSGGVDYPWYLDAWTLFQDTPYDFKDDADLMSKRSCKLNRGTRHSPMLLINHWLEKINPSPEEAKRINDRKILRKRVLRCMRERHMLPNVIAVNFHDQGHVLEVVKELNGIPANVEPVLPSRGRAIRGRSS